jgi:GT2 family glycosyltransferase
VRGDLVVMLSAGDLHFDDTLRIVADAAARHPRTDCFYGDTMLMDAAGKPFAEFNAMAWSQRAARHRLRLCPPAVFIRRQAIERTGPLDAALEHWADYDLWLRLARAGATFAHIPRLLAACRTATGKAAPSDFTTLPSRQSLDELMHVRLQSRFWRLSATRLAWYGATRALVAAPAEDAPIRIGEALQYALEGHRRWGTGRPAGPSRRIAIAARLVGLLSTGRFRKEFRVKPLDTMRIRPFQLVRRKVFRLRHHAPQPLSLPPHYARPRILGSPPSISIVTPSFNQGHLLEATLRSVLDQNYPRLEYVVQDGGSTDESIDVLRRHASRLTYWDSAPDGGQAAAINLGMQRTTGEIMAYLNSDDLLLPGSLAYVAEYFQEHPTVDVVYGHRVVIDERGAEVGRWVLPPHDDQAIAFADFIPQETMFWRRRAWERVGASLDESFHFAMDWDLILRFRAAGLVFRRAPRFLGAFRVSPQQKSLAAWLPFGRRESERLTERTLGTTPSRETTRRELRRYIWRQWIIDKLYLAGIVGY